MKKFITHLFLFTIVLSIVGEVSIRIFKLTSDIPQRFIEQSSGLQLYKPGQSGYYKKAAEKWEVNQYGWLGIANTEKRPLFSIIGDSYIENIMNPISCNQGFILQSHFDSCSFFEAGRSGVTFIEALEISKYLDSLIRPTYHLIYLGDGDFNESITQIHRFSDRVQVDLDKKLILKAKMKAPVAKKILYSSKLLYYMYLRFPSFINKQNKGETLKKNGGNITPSNYLKISELFQFCASKYNLDKIILIFHPKTDNKIINIAKSFKFKTFTLQEHTKSWALGEHDGHWSCYGHHEAVKQIIPLIDSLIKVRTHNNAYKALGK
jgi:hypothetical protein